MAAAAPPPLQMVSLKATPSTFVSRTWFHEETATEGHGKTWVVDLTKVFSRGGNNTVSHLQVSAQFLCSFAIVFAYADDDKDDQLPLTTPLWNGSLLDLNAKPGVPVIVARVEPTCGFNGPLFRVDQAFDTELFVSTDVAGRRLKSFVLFPPTAMLGGAYRSTGAITIGMVTKEGYDVARIAKPPTMRRSKRSLHAAAAFGEKRKKKKKKKTEQDKKKPAAKKTAAKKSDGVAATGPKVDGKKKSSEGKKEKKSEKKRERSQKLVSLPWLGNK